jgi:hypothetical protein
VNRGAEIGLVAATLILVACDGKVSLGNNGTRAPRTGGAGGASGGQAETGGSPTAGGTGAPGGALAGSTSTTGGDSGQDSTGGVATGGVVDAAAALLPAPVLDPAGTYAGKTYAEWGTEWFKWLLELPGPDFPIDDYTGALCALGQSVGNDGGATLTDVFFLAGASSSAKITRTCAVPAGEMIFVPMAFWDVDNTGADQGQLTVQELQNMAATYATEVTGLTLEIDGQPYGSNVSDFGRYLTVWAQFSYAYPNTPTNWCATYPFTCVSSTISGPVPVSFGGGYWILLAPLPAGSHTIHFAATGGQDLTYNLTVQ